MTTSLLRAHAKRLAEVERALPNSRNAKQAALLATLLMSGQVMADTAPATDAGSKRDANSAQIRGEDPDLRARKVLAAMTFEEKISLLHGPMPGFMAPAKRPVGVPVGAGIIYGIPRLAVPNQVSTDASLGVSNFGHRPGDVATALPSGLLLASSWDPEILRAGGAMIGSEARAKGFNVMLAGGVNLVRDPRAGRNFEYLGEDPLLAGVLGGQQIRGVQSNHIIATIKHYALNDQETGRNVHSVNMAEEAMRESDLLAFQIGLEKGDPGSVMCSYNRVNGTYACENRFLLTDVLRGDWGFKGFVMSDWGAVHSSEALLAGLDQQSGEQLDAKPYFSVELQRAIAEGRVSREAVDMAALRILRTIFAYGLADHPVGAPQAIDYAAHGKIARDAAAAGIVLLKNEKGILPVATSARRIVVIGARADLGVISGGGSSSVTPVGGWKLQVRSARGIAAAFAKKGYGGVAPLAALKAAFPQAELLFDDGTDPKRAAAVARAADLVVVIAEKWTTEAEDNLDLSLPDGQDALIDAVADSNPRTIVALETGNPVLMPWADKVPAILSIWYPGQEGGHALADILTGKVNPSGHLPITFPASLEQLPLPELPGANAPKADKETRATYGLSADTKPFDIVYPEGSDVGYRWFDARKATPLFAFGHGLSYTSFRYDGLQVQAGRTLKVTFNVTNTGDRAGADVPQVYVRRDGKAKRLIGWGKPTLRPGESRKITIEADPRVIGDYDVEARNWVVPAGTYTVELGQSALNVVATRQVKLRRQTRKP
jgi:beta-glucosidase